MSVLDKTQISRSFGNASQSYDDMAALQRKVGNELVRYLDNENHQERILDIGCGTGFFTEKIINALPDAELLALDIALPMLLKTQQRLTCEAINLVCADAEQLPFIDNSFQQVVSNLALQWCYDLSPLFKGLHDVLKPSGVLIFSTFGEQALCELKSAWSKVDNFPHVNDFCNADELQQALYAAGFIEVNIVKKTYQHEYASVIALMKELKGIGAHNTHQQRNRHLTSKGQLKTLLSAYPQTRQGTIKASFEILYVQARR